MKYKALDIIYKWIMIKDISKTNIYKSVSDFKGNNIIGFFYVDNTAGVTLDVVCLFDYVNDNISITENLLEKKIRVMLRYSSFKDLDIELFETDQISTLGLTKPIWISSYEYESEDLITTRKDRQLDKYRHDDYPDDIKVLLIHQGLQPETVWCRLEKTISDGFYICRLINQPNQDFKISNGEQIEVFIGFVGTKAEKNRFILCKTSLERLERFQD